MTLPPQVSKVSLRELFDEIVELAPDARAARMATLDLPGDARAQLHAMLVFDELVGLAPDMRDVKLASLDLSDAIRARLQSMLATDARVPDLLQAGPEEAINLIRDGEEQELGRSLVGTNVGTFRLLELIGQGGSSTVFRAEREVGSGAQVVALKLLRTGLYSADAQRRFRREQAILAHLTHPNIAHLIEGGVSSSGIPYIAMELVDGVPITDAANARGLTIEERLAWVSRLCRTIEVAHSALIVHLDLKPSNILITRDGDLKILDFGIAKLLDDEAYTTRTQSVALTPEYAAPEQFTSAPLTTAVDVYTLGVVLGELLTGQRLNGSARASQAVAGSAVAIPDGLPSRQALLRRLRGDLDAILSTALADEPKRRFRTAEAFADDIDRYLDGQPVRAHPPSRWYRTRKFLARHRTGVVLTAVLLIGILSSLALAIWEEMRARNAAAVASEQARRANFEAARATGEEKHATAVADFLIGLFQVSDPGVNRGEHLSANEILERGAAKVEHDFATQPEERVRMQAVIGEVYAALGDFARAQPPLEQAVKELESRPAADGFEIGHDLRVLAWTLINRDDATKALKLLDEAQSRLESSKSPQVPDELIRVRSIRASAMSSLGDTTGAQREFNAAIDYARRAKISDHVAMTWLHNNFGILLQNLGDLPGARSELEQAVAISRRELGQEHYRTLAAISNLGNVLVDLGEFGDARTLLEENAAKQKQIFGDNDTMYAATQSSLGGLALKENRFDESMEHYATAERTYRAVFGDRNEYIVQCAVLEGDVEFARGNYAAAKSQYDRVVEISQAGSDLNGKALGLIGRSRLFTQLGKYKQARDDAEAALAIVHERLAPDHPWAVRSLLSLGLALQGLGDTDGARKVLDEAAERAPRTYAHNPQALGEVTRAVSAAERTFTNKKASQ